MKRLICAMMFASTTATASDLLYVNVELADAAALMIQKDLPLPATFEPYAGSLWGFLDPRDASLDEYLDRANGVMPVTLEQYNVVAASCGEIKPECVLPILRRREVNEEPTR